MTLEELTKELEDLKSQINKPKPIEATMKHNHSGGDYVKINYSNLSGLPTIPTMFSGSVAANGTALDLPTGWTSAHNSDGDYTVTHNLGYATYNVVLTTSGDYGMIKINGKGATTFGVRNLDPTGAFLLDTKFDFVLVKY
jgi:hypothetical protein